MAVTINGSAGVTTNSGAVYNGLQTDTAKSATGTSVDFTGIPSWVKRITVMLNGVSTNGTSVMLIQLGDAGGIENTGYLGSGSTAAVFVNYTTGFGLSGAQAAARVYQGGLTISLISGNTWACFGVTGLSDQASTNLTGGTKTLSDTLTQVRITTVNGTDTFDAGTINIIYE